MNVLCIVQARIGSTRLPGKILLSLEGKTVLEHVINRVKASNKISDVVLATTISKDDVEVVRFVSSLGIRVFAGSENDVLDRFYQAAKLLNPDHVVRITSDCPMIDPELIDKVIVNHSKTNADYTSNTIVETYPDGEDVEVIKFSALKRAHQEAELESEREHVTPYVRKHPEIFKLHNVGNSENLSGMRWTIDQNEDYEFLKIIFRNLYHKNPLFGMNEILDFLKENPDIEEINSKIIRNEGYLKSLKQDKIIN